MSAHLNFPSVKLEPRIEGFRQEVRAFLDAQREAGAWEGIGQSWGAHNPAMSRRLGKAGYIGLTWPKEYGGKERSYLERYVYTEEILASGAPAGAHWVADRQSGPLLIRFGTAQQKELYLPLIVKGELYFSIGMSEPDSGSDLASMTSKIRSAPA